MGLAVPVLFGAFLFFLLDLPKPAPGTAQVELTADATVKQGTQHVSWLVTVRVRAGRWEVVTLDSVPGVRGAGSPQISSANTSTHPK